MSERRENCTRCYFFESALNPEDGESMREAAERSSDQEGYAGFCHRFPPCNHHRNSNGLLPSVGPVVESLDWCGEFQEAEIKVTREL